MVHLNNFSVFIFLVHIFSAVETHHFVWKRCFHLFYESLNKANAIDFYENEEGIPKSNFDSGQ